MANTFEGLAIADLDRLCHLAFWLGLGGDREMNWGETREEMELFLAGVSPEVWARFRAFLAIQDDITVPEEHSIRVANLPVAVRKVALGVAPLIGREPSTQDALEKALSEEDSLLLLRWATWSGEIPRHAAWWYKLPEERPTP